MANCSPSFRDDVFGHIGLNHPDLVRAWFNDLQLIDLSAGVLSVQANNGAQLKYLLEHCQPAFAEAAQAATGRLVSVAFDAIENPNDPYLAGQSGTGSTSDELQLRPENTFEHFVTGPCNRLAHAAATAVATAPGETYNPFFIHGGVGLGKSHLLQAICHKIRSENKQAKILYISCETFINHFIESVERGAIHQFRYRYRHVDGLVIDDVQFLAERERSQEEFFHTFNALHQSQRQIILTADCSPSEIPSLEERLVSRFNSGLVALVERPCLETRMAILRKKAKLRCVEVPEDVIRLIAGRLDTNIRDLEGALLKLDALSHAQGSPVTIELARSSLGPLPGRSVSIPIILDIVAKRFNVKVTELRGKKRFKAVTYPRHICMYLARQLTDQSLEQIGGYFGGRDHTTVLHGSRTIAKQAKADPDMQRVLDQLHTEVQHAAY